MQSSTTGKKHSFTRRKILGATGLGLVGLTGAGGAWLSLPILDIHGFGI
ncbi:hypothetical protein [Ktedonobacter sp. SOSP1-85]|nr:hypothetical protein [Ktedonobacter sp. SOSP1-85]